MSSPRPTDPALIGGGDLGLLFLIANQAIIDYGSSVLYVKAKPAT